MITIRAMQSGLIFEVAIILQSTDTLVHGFGTKPKRSYFYGGRLAGFHCSCGWLLEQPLNVAAMLMEHLRKVSIRRL